MITTNNVSVVPRKATSKFGVIKLSYAVLASVLRLPQSFEVVNISDDPKYNGIINDESFQPAHNCLKTRRNLYHLIVTKDLSV